MNKLNDATKQFLILLESFEYSFTGYDKIWNIIFPMSLRKWVHINAVLYNDSFYINEMLHDYPSLEIPAKVIEVKEGKSFGSYNNSPLNSWLPLLQSAIVHLINVQKNWLQENTDLQNNFPLKYREGIVPHHIINECYPDLINIKKVVGNHYSNQIIKLIETNYFRNSSKLSLKTFTANQFFGYCKIAYNAVYKKIDNSIKEGGKGLYKLYADGRDEGLLEIKVNDKKEFANWLDDKHPKRSTGGHPWEILRGGNTTNILLRVSRSDDGSGGFLVTLHGDSVVRMKETIAIALAFKKAGLPFMLGGADDLRLRLLAQDDIGILPENETMHRVNQRFEEETVFNAVYFYDIKNKYKVIEPFVTWHPLPILKPIK